MDEADARFDEALDVIVKAWTADEPFSHRGKYWQFDEIVVEPPTAQQPHPPIWMGAGSERSIRRVAAQGYNLLLGQYASPGDVANSIAIYRSEIEAQGRPFDPMQVAVTRAFFVCDSQAERAAADGAPARQSVAPAEARDHARRHRAWRTRPRHRRSAGGQRGECDVRQSRSHRRTARTNCAPPASATCWSTAAARAAVCAAA